MTSDIQFERVVCIDCVLDQVVPAGTGYPCGKPNMLSIRTCRQENLGPVSCGSYESNRLAEQHREQVQLSTTIQRLMTGISQCSSCVGNQWVHNPDQWKWYAADAGICFECYTTLTASRKLLNIMAHPPRWYIDKMEHDVRRMRIDPWPPVDPGDTFPICYYHSPVGRSAAAVGRSAAAVDAGEARGLPRRPAKNWLKHPPHQK